MDDVVLNKIATIERCILRIKEEYNCTEAALKENYTKQDAIVLNIQRAVQAALDMAMHIVRLKKLGIPQRSKDVFLMLEKQGILTSDTSNKMQKMVGFRNIAVHDYRQLNMNIMIAVLNHHLVDFTAFVSEILQHEKSSS